MVMAARLVLLLCCAGLPLGAGEAPPAVLAGPWQTWTGTGTEIAVRLAPGGGAGGLALELDGRRHEAPPALRALPAGGVVAAWRLPADCAAQRFAVLAGDQRLEGTPARAPDEDDAARIAIASPRAWPAAADLDRLAAQLGGPLQAVLVPDGASLAPVLGQGGWEADLPLLTVRLAAEEERDALLGGERPGAGLRWGALGLPACRGAADAATAIGGSGGRWQVLLQAPGPWDPGLLAPAGRQDPAPLAPLLRLAAALRLPLVVAGGDLAGVLTGPLAADEQGGPELRAGGSRYLVAGGGGPTGPLPPLVDLPIDRPTLIGLAADEQRLLLVLQPASAAPEEAVALAWPRWDGREPVPGGGWGGGDPVALRAVLDASPAADGAAGAARAAAEELAAMARPRLRQGGEGDGEGLRRLLAAPAGDGEAPPPWLRRLALHLLGDGDYRAGRVRNAGDLPAWAQREAVLRAMAQPRLIPSWWAGAVAAGGDAALVMAAIRLAERHPGPELLEVLVERLRRQAAGTTPPDADPLLQSRLTAAVFDSPYLSPTPLRPIAIALRRRLDPLGLGPVERFLARHGEERPAGR